MRKLLLLFLFVPCMMCGQVKNIQKEIKKVEKSYRKLPYAQYLIAKHVLETSEVRKGRPNAPDTMSYRLPTGNVLQLVYNPGCINDLVNLVLKASVITEVCGIPFGSTYEEAKAKLQAKYGECDRDVPGGTILYKRKKFEGMEFDKLDFWFLEDKKTNRTYFCGAMFNIECKTKEEAIKKKEYLDYVISHEYAALINLDKKGEYKSRAGLPPVPSKMGLGFAISIDVFERYGEDEANTYHLNLAFGPYDYLK